MLCENEPEHMRAMGLQTISAARQQLPACSLARVVRAVWVLFRCSAAQVSECERVDKNHGIVQELSIQHDMGCRHSGPLCVQLVADVTMKLPLFYPLHCRKTSNAAWCG